MDPTTVEETIAYCGLICRLCFRASECDGCKTTNNGCDRISPEASCFQRTCCEDKGLKGCWQCSGLRDCTNGIYSLGDYSKIKAFAICIREDGINSFVAGVLRNQAKGLSVEKGQDYDGKLIPVVLRMLRIDHE